MSKMYNEEQKMRYVGQCKYEQVTIESVVVFFNGAGDVERFYDKDLSQFIIPEIEDLLGKMNSKSRGYLTSMCVVLADYYAWCYSEGLISDIVNKYDVAFTKRIIEEVIPNEMMENKYFTQSKEEEYEDLVYDPTNKFILRSLYLGIKGDEFEEVVNIKPEDLDKENKILSLITGRQIKVDDSFIELMEEADKASQYSESGETLKTVFDYCEYIQTGYVLKQMARGKNNPNAISIVAFQKRLRAIKKQSENEFLTAPVIYKNGLINHIIKRHRELESDISLDEILFKQVNKKLYQYDELTKEFINEYGSKIEVKRLRKELIDFVDCFK